MTSSTLEPASLATRPPSQPSEAALYTASTDPVELLDEVPLTSAEAGYVEAARAANPLRGYRSGCSRATNRCSEGVV